MKIIKALGEFFMNKVQICGVDTSKLPMLKAKEMENLLRRIKNGETELRDQFIEANLRLVLSVIQRFTNKGEQIDDLFQVGCIGLIKAIDNFDFSHNVKFSTYAVPMIIGEIRRYIRDNNSIRVSRSMRDIAYKALTTKNALAFKLNREPSIMEIAEEMDCPYEEIVFALDAIQDPISLFEPIYNDSGDTIYVMDQIRDKRADDNKWFEEIALRNGIKKLNQREKNILFLRFYKGKTQVEVADEIGISQAQVSRLEKNALKNMRRHIDF